MAPVVLPGQSNVHGFAAFGFVKAEGVQGTGGFAVGYVHNVAVMVGNGPVAEAVYKLAQDALCFFADTVFSLVMSVPGEYSRRLWEASRTFWEAPRRAGKASRKTQETSRRTREASPKASSACLRCLYIPYVV